MFWIIPAFLALALASVILAAIGWLLSRRRGNRLKLTLVGFLVPTLLVTLQLGGCYTLQQVKAATGHKHFWFFKGVCPLAGDYELTFDSEFRFGSIARHGEDAERGPVQNVAALQVIDSKIIGQYTAMWSSSNSYFVLDTQTGQKKEFATRAELEAHMGRTVALKSVDDTFAAAP